MNNKRGISLIVLVITVVVMAILASTVIFFANDTMINSKMSAFALDLKNVEDLVYEYYLNNNELPVDTTKTYNKQSLVNFITKGKNDLSSEIDVNKDEDETFYIVDLEKLSVESTGKGMQLNGGTIDSYVITKDSMHIYYLKGEKIRDKYYFSLTQEIINKTKLDVDRTLDDSTINIINVTSSIDYKKSAKDWTNNLTVEIKTEIASEESLTYMLAGTDITGSVTTNIVDVSNILLNNETIKSDFNDADSNKILTVRKTKNGQIVSEAKVDVSNLDILSGNIVAQANVKHTKYSDYILANISGYSDLGGSGLREIRVVYTTKSDEEGNNKPYYDNLPEPITKDYIYSAGNKNKGLLIKLPVDVTGYALVFIDNAGNISDVNTYTVEY